MQALLGEVDKASLADVPGTGLITPLTAVFRDGSLPVACTAAAALHRLGHAQPALCEGMVEGGMLELVLDYYIDVGDLPQAAIALSAATTSGIRAGDNRTSCCTPLSAGDAFARNCPSFGSSCPPRGMPFMSYRFGAVPEMSIKPYCSRPVDALIRNTRMDSSKNTPLLS